MNLTLELINVTLVNISANIAPKILETARLVCFPIPKEAANSQVTRFITSNNLTTSGTHFSLLDLSGWQMLKALNKLLIPYYKICIIFLFCFFISHHILGGKRMFFASPFFSLCNLVEVGGCKI